LSVIASLCRRSFHGGIRLECKPWSSSLK